MLAFGIGVAMIVCRLGTLTAMVAAALAAGFYFSVCIVSFALGDVWLPVFVPLVVQVPVAFILGLTLQYLGARRAVRLYVPAQVAEKLVTEGDRLTIAENVYGTCMSTDVAGFTGVSERMKPDELSGLLNHYFAVLGEPIHRHAGVDEGRWRDALYAFTEIGSRFADGPTRFYLQRCTELCTAGSVGKASAVIKMDLK